MLAGSLEERGRDVAQWQDDRDRRDGVDEAVPDRVGDAGASRISRQLASVQVLGSMSPLQNLDRDTMTRAPSGRTIEARV